MESAGNQRLNSLFCCLVPNTILFGSNFFSRMKSSLVGTSETTRVAIYPQSFCEWLAGVIDGDGSLQIKDGRYTSLEITMGLEDLPLLRFIQHHFSGSIKLRSGSKSYRYRLTNRPGMIKLVNCINGHIRNSARLPQLHRVCQVLDIPLVTPIKLTADSYWFSGFFDADGTVSFTKNKERQGRPKLAIKVANKRIQDVQMFHETFGGTIQYDATGNGVYQWGVESHSGVILMANYLKSHPGHSRKLSRAFLVEDYFILRKLEAYKVTSPHHNAWCNFERKWFFNNESLG